jgi:hypothetical protein
MINTEAPLKESHLEIRSRIKVTIHPDHDAKIQKDMEKAANHKYDTRLRAPNKHQRRSSKQLA